MRFIFLILFLIAPGLIQAQQRDSYFESYAAYAEFVDSEIKQRDFKEMVQVLGGRDEYTPEELEGLSQRFLSIFPSDFTHATVTRAVDLGSGFRQEMRIYWTQPAGQYLFFYAFLHERDDGLVVLTFNANTDVDKIIALF